MHSREAVIRVLALANRGLSDRAIEQATGINRRTVSGWRHGRVPNFDRRDQKADCFICRAEAERIPGPAYSYLLGMYLGDGCISAGPRTFKLRVFHDAQYPTIVSRCAEAMEAIRPTKKAWQGRHKHERCIEVTMHWNHWPCLFPQHGPGRKHERPIVLEPWQQMIVTANPERLVRGLIESDGCRIVANDRGVASVRYHFSNRSEDIKRIYCATLDQLEIPWTRPCNQQIAVYRKAATARMDEFIGPKS